MMAEPYLEQLTQIINRLTIMDSGHLNLKAKHFFNGAALYANGTICVLFSPMGFALKLPAEQGDKLIAENRGTTFRFFPNGPIKRKYIALSDSVIQDDAALRGLLIASIEHVVGLTN